MEKKKIKKPYVRKANHYVDHEEFNAVMVKSKELGELTPRAGEIIQLMIEHLSRALPKQTSFDQEFKEDIKACATYTCCKNWHKYDVNENTAFAWFTTVIRNGLFGGFREYSRGKTDDIHIPLDLLLKAQNEEN
jgi:hypothetical protein